MTRKHCPQVLRDGVDQAARHRRLQAPGGDPARGEQDRRVQARVSVDLRLGDPRPAAVRGRLQQRQHPQRECLTIPPPAVPPPQRQTLAPSARIWPAFV
jgi:hypothetical protein